MPHVRGTTPLVSHILHCSWIPPSWKMKALYLDVWKVLCVCQAMNGTEDNTLRKKECGWKFLLLKEVLAVT